MSTVVQLHSRSRRIKALAAAAAAGLMVAGSTALAQVDPAAVVSSITAADAVVIAIGSAVLGVLATILAFKLAKRLM
ncbi:major capsid protein [Gilvimarinus algae]|uniref:Major capsid protein n=1 Tax=Gilvimarinus algae TaxID=3058037 RepID=A0ABT8TIC1_9GAMM|nr:major capsid protein [Gilvimarinus sp. SDUM040014]MDO3383851.1 major capsid protein [Gilvimarinus sp. SDUM040014]